MTHLSPQQLSAHLDSALHGASLQTVETHLEMCEKCRDELAALTLQDQMLSQALRGDTDRELFDLIGLRVQSDVHPQRARALEKSILELERTRDERRRHAQAVARQVQEQRQQAPGLDEAPGALPARPAPASIDAPLPTAAIGSTPPAPARLTPPAPTHAASPAPPAPTHAASPAPVATTPPAAPAISAPVAGPAPAPSAPPAPPATPPPPPAIRAPVAGPAPAPPAPPPPPAPIGFAPTHRSPDPTAAASDAAHASPPADLRRRALEEARARAEAEARAFALESERAREEAESRVLEQAALRARHQAAARRRAEEESRTRVAASARAEAERLARAAEAAQVAAETSARDAMAAQTRAETRAVAAEEAQRQARRKAEEARRLEIELTAAAGAGTRSKTPRPEVARESGTPDAGAVEVVGEWPSDQELPAVTERPARPRRSATAGRRETRRSTALALAASVLILLAAVWFAIGRQFVRIPAQELPASPVVETPAAGDAGVAPTPAPSPAPEPVAPVIPAGAAQEGHKPRHAVPPAAVHHTESATEGTATGGAGETDAGESAAAQAEAQAEPAEEPLDLGLLCGTVRDDEKRPIAGARVMMADVGVVVVTDRVGRFCLTAPRGTRTLSVIALGFGTYRQTVSVGRRTGELSVTLQSAGPSTRAQH